MMREVSTNRFSFFEKMIVHKIRKISTSFSKIYIVDNLQVFVKNVFSFFKLPLRLFVNCVEYIFLLTKYNIILHL